MSNLIAQVKRCTTCGVEKPLGDYYRERLGRYGVRSKCKPCMLGPGHGKPPGPTPVPILERFKEDEHGCWLWTGAVGRHGYATVKWQGVSRVAHRVVWTLLRGEIPRGLVLDHLCNVKHCVNPDHLEPVTNAVNIQRAWDGRHCVSCRCSTPMPTGQTTQDNSE